MRLHSLSIRTLLCTLALLWGGLLVARAQSPIPYIQYFEDKAHWKTTVTEIPIEWKNLNISEVQIFYYLDGEEITPAAGKLKIPKGHHRLSIVIKEKGEKKWLITYNLNAE